jgi:small conductance mechanosensitive channel
VILPYPPTINDSHAIVVAVAADSPASIGDAERKAELRSNQIERNISGILLQLSRVLRAEPQAVTQSFPLRFWLIFNPKPMHPLTPRLQMGMRNGQTVIYMSEQEGVARQTIMTVTPVDAESHGLPLPQLGEQWMAVYQDILSDALWGMEFNRQHPLIRPTIVLGLTLGIFACIAMMLTATRRLVRVMSGLRQLLRQQEQQLRDQVLDSYAVTAQSSSCPVGTGLRGDQPSDPEATEVAQIMRPAGKRLRGSLISRDAVTGWFKSFVLNRPYRVQRLLSWIIVLNRVQLILFVILVLLIAVSVLLIYPASRSLAIYLGFQSVAIPLLWLTMGIAQPLLNLLANEFLNSWRQKGLLLYRNTSRYELRINTYTKVWSSAIAVFCIGLGVYGTIAILGFERRVLASAGVLAIIIGFLGRNLLEDMFSGIMILLTDRYAIGDVISVGEKGGLVEEMNLFTTQLRGLAGELTTIPNRQINEVDNYTKEWSRVNFTIRVACSADIDRAIGILKSEAESLQGDEQWSELILRPVEVLGVDEVDRRGVLIRVWIVTLPMKQWAVAREYRLRIQKAFLRESIQLGTKPFSTSA